MSWNILNLYFKKRNSTKERCSYEIPYRFSAARIDEGTNDGEDGVNDDNNDHGEDLGNGNAGFGGDGKIEYDVIDRVTINVTINDTIKFFGGCSN